MGRGKKIALGVGGVFVGLVVLGTLLPDTEKTQPTAAVDTPSTTADSTEAPTTHSTPTPDADASFTRLNTLTVKGRAPKTGYDRGRYGQAWSDDVAVDGGHNGCDTRNDILKRDLKNPTFRPGTRDCVVLTGTLHDPYTGTTIEYTRENGTAVEIDHVVSLSDAWQKGAQQLGADERRNFANDPRNLQATDGPTYQKKAEGDAATWLPPAKDYRCTYVSRQIDVKAAYRLWVTQAEKDAMTRVLGECGATIPTTTSSTPATSTPSRTATRTPVPAPRETTRETTREPAPTYTPPATTRDPAPRAAYKNCTEARRAGAAPVYRGQPGYGTHLDRDGDGIGCDK